MRRKDRPWGYKERWFAWFPVWDRGWSPVRGHFNDFMWLQIVERTWGPVSGYDWMGGCSCCHEKFCGWHYRDPDKWPKC